MQLSVMLRDAADDPINISYGDQKHEAWLDLFYTEPGPEGNPFTPDREQMGELITVGMSRDEAIWNMVGFVRILGYDGSLIFYTEGDHTEICKINCDAEKPKVKGYKQKEAV